jgi:alpha-ketoglutarate-dependent taurine dioxygenase
MVLERAFHYSVRRIFCRKIKPQRRQLLSSSVNNRYSFLEELPWQYLRASDSALFDPITQQRKDVSYDTITGKPLIVVEKPKQKEYPVTLQNYKIIGNGNQNYNTECQLFWSDGVRTTHDLFSLERQYRRWKHHHNDKEKEEGRTFWTDLSEDYVRNSSELSISFDRLIMDEVGMKSGLSALHRFGILLITGTPVEDNGAGVATIAAALGGGKIKESSANSILSNYRAGGSDIVLPAGTDGPMRTLYGTVWSTSSSAQPIGTSVADSAYGSDGLPLHTDFTYQADPPGLQIFTMVQPALEGGESVFGDGFAVAETLRCCNPAAFDMLSKTVRTYHCKDEVTGWSLQASGPIIQVEDGRVVCIRHNDLDRLPILPPYDSKDIDAFYDELNSAHEAWDSLLAQDEFRLVMKLKRGDTMVVVNQVSAT